jgi:hypothetical protein
MVTPVVSKLINKLAWTARGLGRVAPIETLYQGRTRSIRAEQGAPRVHQAHSRSSLPRATTRLRNHCRRRAGGRASREGSG